MNNEKSPSTPKSDRENPVDVTLEKILTTVYEAVKRAQVDVQRGAEKKLDWYFPKNEKGEVQARTLDVPVPQQDGSTATRSIPLFALVPHHDLMIEQVNIRMKLNLLTVFSSQNKPNTSELGAQIPGAGADPDLYAEIEVRLKGVDPVEGVARLNDVIVKRI